MMTGYDLAKDELEYRYNMACHKIAIECEEEGYPSHGSNYELRCESAWESLMEEYGWLFEEDEDDEEDEEVLSSILDSIKNVLPAGVYITKYNPGYVIVVSGKADAIASMCGVLDDFGCYPTYSEHPRFNASRMYNINISASHSCRGWGEWSVTRNNGCEYYTHFTRRER